MEEDFGAGLGRLRIVAAHDSYVLLIFILCKVALYMCFITAQDSRHLRNITHGYRTGRDRSVGLLGRAAGGPDDELGGEPHLAVDVLVGRVGLGEE
ncbi:hypothetical protein GCM10020369_30480 [Cryptosporangium minutisporangium]|uniref:Uncharacterized protein n=1 Tax=Cryptosporangium minutisporangium TaxID=113569 RepID=A0ABP6SYG8_9ACTN